MLIQLARIRIVSLYLAICGYLWEVAFTIARSRWARVCVVSKSDLFKYIPYRVPHISAYCHSPLCPTQWLTAVHPSSLTIQPMSWARIAAGPAKPFVRPASAATGLPRSTHESSRVSQAASEGVVAISRAQVEENADDECRSEVDQTPNGRGSRSVDIIDVVDVVDAENGVGSSGKGLVGEGKVEVALARANGHASNVTAERKAGETEVVVPRARYSNGSASPGTEKGDGGGEKKQKPRQGVGEDYEKIRVADRSAKNKGANEGANNGVEVCAEEAGLDSTAAETEKESEEVKGQRAWLALLGMLGSEDGAAPVGKDATVLHGGDLGPSLGDLLHRGLVNTGNSCFRSAVLQALLACEPFVK